ncbi:MAG TPA: PAS domain S-box protein [Caulobacteraceae bacterium]|nr:PAS domain S-box protein [Caulobacteraceae bacterium]
MAEVPDADDLQFRLLAEQLPTPCWIAEATGHVVWFNADWVAYTGMTVENIGPRGGLRALHDPAIYPEVERRWQACMESGEPAEMTFPLLGRDGTFRPFHTRVVPLRDANGAVFRWFGTNTDVSAQSVAEARLASSQEQWRELFEASGDAIFITDRDNRYVEVNPAACALLGFERDELIGMRVPDLLDTQEQTRHAAWRRERSKGAAHGEWRMRRKGGGWVDVEVNARPLAEGRFLATARDIGERVRERAELRRQVGDEAALRAQAERQRERFWDVSHDLFAIISQADGVPQMLNERAWRDTLGYEAAELTRTPLIELAHPDDREATVALSDALAKGEAVFGFENRYRRADGGWVWLSWNIIRDGELTYVVARDVTEEKARAQHAERSQRLVALGQLIGGVAHDFNNLLMTIIGSLDLLQRRSDDHQLRERMMTAALAAARRGERLNRQLLTFARGQSGAAQFADVNALIEASRPLLDGALREDIALTLDLDPEIEGCQGDPAAFEATLLNLVVNARDAMPGGGRLTVRTRRPDAVERARHSLAGGDHAVVEVEDTGFGMTAEVAARAFEPFFTTKDVGQGSGLGLSQVYGFARQSGGIAVLESEPGAGARVKLFLKIAVAPEPRTAAIARERRTAAGSVLLVEDDVLVGVVTASMLAESGWDVKQAADAQQALARLDEGPVDLLLTDIRMPGGMNGAQLAAEAVRRLPGLRVVLCSGWTAEAVAGDLAGTRWPFLKKPFDTEQLAEALARAS